MEQLSGLDASFLYLETGNMPMHIGSLAIYDQSTAPGGYNGQITVSASSCREWMPDPAFYCDCLTEAFGDLRKAAKRPAKRRGKNNGPGRVSATKRQKNNREARTSP